MATTKKSTKAKTKTSSTKTAKKTAAKKVSSAKTASKSTTVKVTKPSKQPRILNVQRLLSLHTISVGVFLLLAVAAVLLMGNESYQLTLGHMTKDQFNSGAFAPAIQVLYDVEIRWMVVLLMVVSAVAPVLYLTRLKQNYTDYLTKTRMQPYRWFDLGVTAALMMETVALLSGASDLFTLKLVGGLMFITCMLGLVAERQNNNATTPVKSGLYVGLLSGFLPWLFVASYAVSTVVYGMVRSPWYVYALYATTFVGFSLIAANQWKQYSNKGVQKSSLAVERNYITTNLLVKVAFAAILIAGLAK